MALLRSWLHTVALKHSPEGIDPLICTKINDGKQTFYETVVPLSISTHKYKISCVKNVHTRITSTTNYTQSQQLFFIYQYFLNKHTNSCVLVVSIEFHFAQIYRPSEQPFIFFFFPLSDLTHSETMNLLIDNALNSQCQGNLALSLTKAHSNTLWFCSEKIFFFLKIHEKIS